MSNVPSQKKDITNLAQELREQVLACIESTPDDWSMDTDKADFVIAKALAAHATQVRAEQAESLRLREFQDRCLVFYGMADGSYSWPNSREGDLIRLMFNAIRNQGKQGV